MRRGAKVGGRYRVTRGPLRGGSGEVWPAHDEELGRDVVLKRVLGADPSQAGFDRLRSEARALARFSHPHVVTLFDAVRDGRGSRATTWLVMEYADGGSLDARPPVPAELAAHIGAQIADALVALHGNGIVHADIKPGNVLVTADGTVKLADFGAAYRMGGQETITPNSAIGYTPDYAAPEVIRGRPEPASDIFSLGAMVYALIAGHPPRPARPAPRPGPGSGPLPPTREDGTPPPPSEDSYDVYDSYVAAQRAARGDVELAADVGPLRDVLTRMLKRDPDARPDASTVRELLRDAAGPRAELPPLPPAVPGPVPDGYGDPWSGGTGPSVAARQFVRRHRGPAITATVVVLALAGGLIAWAASGGNGSAGTDARGRTASPQTSAPTPGSRPASVFGADPRAAEPCSLASTSLFTRYGQPHVDPYYGNFNRCDVVVDRGTAPKIDVEFQFVSRDPTDDFSAPVRTSGRVSQVREDGDGGDCTRDLLISGEDAFVSVTAKPVDSSVTVPGTLLCAMADAGAGHDFTVLAGLPPGGQLPRRTPPPIDSLVRVDACTLLSGHALEVIPGVDATDPGTEFGHWVCSWHSTTGDRWVKLTYDRGEAPTADDGTPTRLAGRQAFVTPSSDDHTTSVDVVHRTFTADGETDAETVIVDYGGADSGTTGQRVTVATALATSVAEALPAP